MGMNNAAIEIVTIKTTSRGDFAVAVYPTKSLGWAANYGSLETYNNPSRESAIASLKLSIEVSNRISPSTAEVFGRTISYAERSSQY
jgi:hypothetical protein